MKLWLLLLAAMLQLFGQGRPAAPWWWFLLTVQLCSAASAVCLSNYSTLSYCYGLVDYPISMRTLQLINATRRDQLAFEAYKRDLAVWQRAPVRCRFAAAAGVASALNLRAGDWDRTLCCRAWTAATRCSSNSYAATAWRCGEGCTAPSGSRAACPTRSRRSPSARGMSVCCCVAHFSRTFFRLCADVNKRCLETHDCDSLPNRDCSAATARSSSWALIGALAIAAVVGLRLGSNS